MPKVDRPPGPAGAAPKATRGASEIDQLRSRVDEITVGMVKLLKTRMELVDDIGRIKREIGMDVVDRRRESRLRGIVRELCENLDMNPSMGAKLLDLLIHESVEAESSTQENYLQTFTRAKELEAQGRKIIHMEVGEPDFVPHESVRSSMTEAFDRGFRKYGPPKGMPLLRDALSEYASRHFGASVPRDNIMVTPGAKFACYLAMSLLDPGDDIVVVEPAWPVYSVLALSLNMKTVPVHTSMEGGWEPTPDMVREAADSGARMIILNYPNNPTGKILTGRAQEKIVDVASSLGMYVLSDEIYWQQAGPEWHSVLECGYEKSVVVQSFSKSHSMTGFRVGYAMAGPDMIDAMSRRQSAVMTSVAEPMQYAAMRALETDTAANIRTMRSRLDAMSRYAEEIGLEFVRPDGGMYLFVRTGVDGDWLAREMLDRGVAVSPGWQYGNYGEYVRLSACGSEEILIKGMSVLKDVLEDQR